jgi:hypothetical protein
MTNIEGKRLWPDIGNFRKSLISTPIPILLITVVAMTLDNLVMAQANLLVLFLVLLSMSIWFKGRDFLAGIIMAMAIDIKVTPIFFVIYFIAKKSWKSVLGIVIGIVLFAFLIPTAILGYEKNSRWHREWFERLLEPNWMAFSVGMRPYMPDLFPQNPLNMIEEGEMQKSNLARLLTEKNQALPATIVRYLLKDRNDYGQGKNWYTIHSVRRYARLPVLFGGIPRDQLMTIVGAVQMGFMSLMFLICMHQRQKRRSSATLMEISLVFLTMTLIASSVRSHQFIYWLFPLTVLVRVSSEVYSSDDMKNISRLLIMSCILYLLQGIPYGKAAGMGTWANVILWFVVASSLITTRSITSDQRF